MYKLLICLVLIALIVDDVHAKRGGDKKKKDKKIPNVCESNKELSSCSAACGVDRDCKDETNLNCARKCKEACYNLDHEFGTRKLLCKSVLLRTLIFDRNPELIPTGKAGE